MGVQVRLGGGSMRINVFPDASTALLNLHNLANEMILCNFLPGRREANETGVVK